MPQPFFSIVVPTRGRPKYLRDAVVSALKQDFEDFEVVVSDNFNDGQTQALLGEFVVDRRFRCVRTEQLLNMPEHWEFATQHACGRYILVLTDRSVLKQGALKAIHTAISASETPVEVCSWRWSLYNDTAGSEYGVATMFEDERTESFLSSRLAEEFAHGLGGYVYCLPRGLNSCYESAFMQRVRDKFGTPFKPISPDYYSAFVMLGTSQEILYIDKPLVVFQGNADSNGGRGMTGIDTGYLKALGTYDVYTHVPIKSPLVKNLIFEDFLVAQDVIGGYLKGAKSDWPAYFENCYHELLVKKEAGVLTTAQLDDLFAEWERALTTFEQPVQAVTREKVEKLSASFTFPAHLECIKKKNATRSSLIRFKSWIGEGIRGPFRRNKTSQAGSDEDKWQSVLEICGFG